jgi:hypothetical protein
MGIDGLPIEIPAVRSSVPTLDEWSAVTREVTVKGSSALGCETKMVREWLRVSCRGRNNSGGTPREIHTLTGGGLDAYTFAKGDVASVVVPVVRARRYEALFTWTDRKERLLVDWAGGAPRPVIRFEAIRVDDE